jgi:dCTP deaminase
MLQTKEYINKLIDDKKLVIKPLLDRSSQIGEVSLDLRLGYNFLVSIQGRSPYIDASKNNNDQYPLHSFFQETRRTLGETFLLHPNQTVLASTLEFVKMPQDVYAELNMRSSYLRLGLSVSAFVQPGYVGCISLELTNINKNPINLTVGAPVIQARLFKVDGALNYFSSNRKYVCQVRPIISVVNADADLRLLNKIWMNNNYK